jgi:hypothetical protein
MPAYSLQGDGDKSFLKKCTMRKKVFCTLPTRAAKAEKKSLVTAQRDQQTKEEPLLLVLFESPFASVLTVS